MTKIVSFHVSRDYVRRFSFTDADGRRFTIHHVYPTLADFLGGSVIPDAVNPRTHGDECLKGKLPQKIKETIQETPHDFVLANRGSTIVSATIHYDDAKETMSLRFERHEGPQAIHGMPDGATTDAVIGSIQREVLALVREEHGDLYGVKSFAELTKFPELIPSYLNEARIHLEIITGISERDRIGVLSEGRNTSRQVKGWSMANFNNHFGWLKEILDDQPYGDCVGYEENSGQDVEVLDIIAIVNLFHADYTKNGTSPTQSYSAKGVMTERVNPKKDSTEIYEGFQKLAPLVPDILELHDLIISTLPDLYNNSGGRLGNLGERDNKICKKYKNPMKLNFSKHKATHKIPTGILYPLLASLRALVTYEKGKTKWRTPPKAFWAKHGGMLVSTVFEHFEAEKQNPGSLGKKSLAYSDLFTKARLALLDD